MTPTPNPSHKGEGSGEAGARPYLFFFLSLTPGPSPLVNWIPAASSALLIAARLFGIGLRRRASKSRSVLRPTLARRASSCWLQERKARAARHWSGDMLRLCGANLLTVYANDLR